MFMGGIKMQNLTDLLIKNLIDPKAIFNVVVLDMQGIVYRYTQKQGIDFVDTITPEQGKEGEEVYERAIAKFYRDNVSETTSLALSSCVPYQLWLEERLVEDILNDMDAPCGLEFNINAARFIFDAFERSACRLNDEPDVYQLAVLSSSRISTSRMLLEKCLTGIGLGYHAITHLPGQHECGFLLPTASESLYYISFYNMSEFGSKGNPAAWENALLAAMNPYCLSRNNVTLSMIVEDQPEKCRAAVAAATSLGYKPVSHNQIDHETQLTTNHTL